MKISDFLSLADVMVDIRASDKRQLLQELARKAASRLNIPADPVAAELLKREELGSTGTGGGIAIPHARIKAVTKSFGIMARLREPIEFDAIDSEPVLAARLQILEASQRRDHLLTHLVARAAARDDLQIGASGRGFAAKVHGASACWCAHRVAIRPKKSTIIHHKRGTTFLRPTTSGPAKSTTYLTSPRSKCRRWVKQAFPDVSIVGLFIARRVPEAVDFESTPIGGSDFR